MAAIGRAANTCKLRLNEWKSVYRVSNMQARETRLNRPMVLVADCWLSNWPLYWMK